MKKIYILTAVFALLTLSLNAQMLPSSKFKAVNKTHITDNGKGQQANNNGRPFRAPSKLNSDEFLVGPYTTDYFSTTGKGLYNTIGSEGRVDIWAILDRTEIEQYIGQEIVGYRFATTGTVSCYSFIVATEGPNNWVNNVYEFNLQSSGNYVDVTGTQWHQYYLDEPVTFEVPDSVISVWIGYRYYQESSSTAGNTYTMTPILSNPNSTSHDTYAYGYATSQFYDATSILGGDLAAQLIFRNSSNPTIEISPATQTINDAAAGTVTITGTDIEGNINASLADNTDWYLNPTSFGNTGGDASVTYTGRALSASTTVTATAANDNTVTASATVNYVADLYIVTDNGVTGNWDFTNGTQMTNNNGIYTATFTATADNTYILFARMLGNGVGWNTRYVFGPDSNGDWVWGDFTGGNIDVNDDDPIKLPAGTYTVTINANDGTFTITKLAPELTAPTDGSTVFVGTNEGLGVSTNIPVSGNYLTGALNVSVSGDGFSVSTNSISAADANAGTASITVTYNGTDPNAIGRLTITSSNGEVSTVNVTLTASYDAHDPALITPADNTTLNVGVNEGNGVSRTITVRGIYLTQDLTLTVTGEGFTVSPTTISAADAIAGTTITITYTGTETATGTLTISSNEVSSTINLIAVTPPPAVTGLLRLHMLMVDQFMEEIPSDNKHPEEYGYVLRYEPQGAEAKQSTKVYVDIEKTEAKVNGYYTQAEIDNDINVDTTLLTMDVLTADVEMALDNTNPNILYFEMKGLKDAVPTKDDPYLTKLQYVRNIRKYQEMEPNSIYYGGEPIDPAEGAHHYYDDRTPIVTGKYVEQNFMSYAPMVSTWGVDRRYFEEDGLNNTYGAPIWKTSVGKVVVEDEPQLVKQVINAGTPDETVNPWTSWTVDGKLYSMFFLGVHATGTLPNPDVTNVEYEPYMFRVFVESPTGKLRRYQEKENVHDNGTTDIDFVDGGELAANYKFCVGSFYQNSGTWEQTDQDGEFFFSKTVKDKWPEGVTPDWRTNMMFAAEDGITKDDIIVTVRFYYMVKGWNATRGGDARPGNGSQSPGKAPNDPQTYVHEFVGNASIIGVTYVNAQGMQSDKPFDGLNIVVTRYSDGTTSTTKVIR